MIFWTTERVKKVTRRIARGESVTYKYKIVVWWFLFIPYFRDESIMEHNL
jgi:hypothetical protein